MNDEMRLKYEIDTDGVVEVVGELVLLRIKLQVYRVAHKHAWFADARVANEEQLEQVVTNIM